MKHLLRVDEPYTRTIQENISKAFFSSLPFSRHVVSTLQHFHFIQDIVCAVFMRTEKVIVNNPQSQVITGTINACGCFTIVGDLLAGNADVVQIPECL